MNLDLVTLLKMMGGGIAFLITSAITFFKVYDKVNERREEREEKAREFKRQEAEKEDERRYKRELKLEQDKVNLQKELEQQKQRHVQKLIDAIREEMQKLETKVGDLSTNFAKVQGRLEKAGEVETMNAQMIQDFIQTTTNRFRILEQEMKNGNAETKEYVRTEISKIGKDLIIVKGIADKLRNKSTKQGGK